MSHNTTYQPDDFGQYLSGISRQIRVNSFCRTLLSSLNKGTWFLTASSCMLILAGLFIDIPIFPVYLSLSALTAVFCLISALLILLAPLSAIRIISVADNLTNRHNIILNGYECCIAGRESAFALATIAQGLEFLRENRDLRIAAEPVMPGKIVVAPFLFAICFWLFPICQADISDNKILTGSLEELVSGRSAPVLAELAAQGNIPALLSSSQAESATGQAFWHFAQFTVFGSVAQGGSGTNSARLVDRTSLGNKTYKHSDMTIPAITSQIRLPDENISVNTTSVMPDQNNSSGDESLYDNEFYHAGQSLQGNTLFADIQVSGRPASSENVSDKKLSRTAGIKSGTIKYGNKPYLFDMDEEYVRKSGTFDKFPDRVGYGGLNNEKKKVFANSSMYLATIPIFVDGISRNGNLSVFRQSVPAGQYNIPQVSTESGILPALVYPVNTPLISDDFQRYAGMYFNRIYQNYDSEGKQYE